MTEDTEPFPLSSDHLEVYCHSSFAYADFTPETALPPPPPPSDHWQIDIEDLEPITLQRAINQLPEELQGVSVVKLTVGLASVDSTECYTLLPRLFAMIRLCVDEITIVFINEEAGEDVQPALFSFLVDHCLMNCPNLTRLNTRGGDLTSLMGYKIGQLLFGPEQEATLARRPMIRTLDMKDCSVDPAFFQQLRSAVLATRPDAFSSSPSKCGLCNLQLCNFDPFDEGDEFAVISEFLRFCPFCPDLEQLVLNPDQHGFHSGYHLGIGVLPTLRQTLANLPRLSYLNIEGLRVLDNYTPRPMYMDEADGAVTPLSSFIALPQSVYVMELHAFSATLTKLKHLESLVLRDTGLQPDSLPAMTLFLRHSMCIHTLHLGNALPDAYGEEEDLFTFGDGAKESVHDFARGIASLPTLRKILGLPFHGNFFITSLFQNLIEHKSKIEHIDFDQRSWILIDESWVQLIPHLPSHLTSLRMDLHDDSSGSKSSQLLAALKQNAYLTQGCIPPGQHGKMNAIYRRNKLLARIKVESPQLQKQPHHCAIIMEGLAMETNTEVDPTPLYSFVQLCWRAFGTQK